jgi:hypothetical protein
MREAGKRGMQPYRPEAMRLKFSDVIDKTKLPPLPRPPFGHVSNRPPLMQGTRVPEWGMLGNNLAGDCVVAGRCHETMLFAQATRRPIPRFTSASALSEYSNVLVASGQPPYDPQKPDTDAGLDPVSMAEYCRTIGLRDADGVLHKIDAFASLADVEELLYAVHLFGAGGLGMDIPDSAEAQFEQNHIWDDLTSPGTGGHYTAAMGFNSRGYLVLCTWGEIQAATLQYIEAHWGGAVCYLTKEYMLASGLSPEAINYDALDAYLAELGRPGDQTA